MKNHISSLEFSHIPVMLNEVLKISSPSAQKKFIDCTFGGGGYSKKFLDSSTYVQAIDRDKKAISIANVLPLLSITSRSINFIISSSILYSN